MRRKIFLLLLACLIGELQSQECEASSRHELLTKVLSRHVTDQGVYFRDLCSDKDLENYAQQLNATDPHSLTPKEQLALWLNAYNAYSLKAICSKYPIESLEDFNFGGLLIATVFKVSIWDQPVVKVGGKSYNLRQLDHEILGPTFKDPRIEFAISCGAISCATLRREAYEADALDQQLEDQTRRFINSSQLNSFDTQTNTAFLSPMFNWSRSDFGKSQGEVLLFISRYLPAGLATSIKRAPQRWKIIYKYYDLTLNDRRS